MGSTGLTFQFSSQKKSSKSGNLKRQSSRDTGVFKVEGQFSPAVGSQSDRAVKWEQVPLTLDESEPSNKPSGKSSGDAKSRSLYQRIAKFIKILLPHVGLTIVLLCYIFVGALVLQALEQETELKRRREKLSTIAQIYDDIANDTWLHCERRGLASAGADPISFELWTQVVKRHLHVLSDVHEYDVRQPVEETSFSLNLNETQSRWTLQASVLYALTVLTTTGYDHVTPQTDGGKIVSVFFGLFGIPLMFITAADIGKFLSEMFRRSYSKVLRFWKFFRAKLHQKLLRSGHSLKLQMNGISPDADQPGFAETPPGGDDSNSDDDNFERINLPLFAYFGLILSYCAIGGLLYTSWEKGPLWSFLHAFHFSFNTITTISLGNILVRDPIYLCLIVMYVIIGLAVVTMCVDLASSQLKVFFTKLHYFGRKMRTARSAFEHMSDDIKEAMRIISHIRKTKTNKGNITVDDIKQFLEIQHGAGLQPFVPQNISLIHFMDEEDARSSNLSLFSSIIDHDT